MHAGWLLGGLGGSEGLDVAAGQGVKERGAALGWAHGLAGCGAVVEAGADVVFRVA